MSAPRTPQPPAEVVTTFQVRDVDLPGSSARLALITMDNGFDHTRPTTLGPAGLNNLKDALDGIETRIAAGQLDAVGITGKPYIFAAGADLSAAAGISTLDQAREIAELGHAQLRRLGELGVPSFAFINGVAFGGGLEVGLHCNYRTIASTAVVGLPETLLGLVPGWGGAYLLPRLIGPAAALQVIVANPLQQNRTLTGVKAGELGIADLVLEPADLLVQSLRWAGAVLADPSLVTRTDHTVDPAWPVAVEFARAGLTSQVGQSTSAPYRALDLIAAARTATRDEAFAAEDAVLAELIMSDEFRSGIYAFDLVQRRAKRPAAGVDPSLARTVTKVGVVGAGLMACQLALLFARRLSVPVVLTDVDAGRLDQGLAHLRSEVATLATRGRISRDAATRLTSTITGSPDVQGFADADLVIEAVFEDLTVKQQVLRAVEAVVSAECVLATNTSSLSVTEMAAGLTHPERVVGLHFFNPVAVMPLLEVVRTADTDAATLATAHAVARSLRKTAIGVDDAPSFVVNRLLGRMLAELDTIVWAGTPFQVADAALVGLAPMPPYVLMGLVGPAIALHNGRSLHAAFGDRFPVPQALRAVVEAGRTAFYLPAGKDGTRVADPAVVDLLPAPDQPLTTDQVRQRVLDALADEAARMLAEGVVADPADLDLAMITGAGFQFWNGGLLPLLDRTGTSQRVVGRRFLPPGVASVPTG